MEPTVGLELPRMASSRKRLHQEFEDVSAVDQEAKCAKNSCSCDFPVADEGKWM